MAWDKIESNFDKNRRLGQKYFLLEFENVVNILLITEFY